MEKQKAEKQRLALKKLQQLVRRELVGPSKLNKYQFFYTEIYRRICTHILFLYNMRHNLSVALIKLFLISNAFFGC